MSSLLKALKQQQSPLLKQTSALDASLMASEKGRFSWEWLLWPAVLILGAVLGSAAAWWSDKDQPTEEVRAATHFSWGETASVEPVSWLAKPEPEPEKTEQLTQKSNPSERSNGNPINRPAETKTEREALDLSKVSPDLLQRFEAAVSDTKGEGSELDSSVIPPLSELSKTFQQQVPAFSYDSHMYRSSASERWIELNGRRLYEGNALGPLTILRIDPQRVVFIMDSQAFSQAALENWQP
ncbi:general secretion pathway protein GspB [Idiomarina sp. HP20-50]|uniref:general secretion pathway protein GspB n=1 Tax=Idiomarina sp. HP20-50 TaxID=3070813 RepID=UPI00294AF730|nr:general secretion pathway protein GspB [Idiomarina sp. HP20-50]MDV6315828.1 general secretion pathway protein GspB [Idiomarina sp. HP20-50]